jgi:DNA helicase IV
VSDDPVLTAERAHLDHARSCLDEMRASAQQIADYGVDELASEGLGRVRARRLAALSAEPEAPPFFGRIDRDPPSGAAPETFHIGRRHILDERGDPLVIDWRAPIARAFYRATPRERMGVRLRRRYGFARTATGAQLTSFEDEHLGRGEALGLASDLLREEIERPRVGPMRDIVATIQPDQDDLVRADLDTSMCIQGAPGTGKTAVGLHRAAYLLYSYPQRLRRSGVLVVGPNRAFLHYISQVLPALGEGGITQTTVDQLIAAVTVRAEDPAELATLKGDGRMAAVLRRAVLSHVVKPVDDLLAVVGTKRYRVPEHRLRRYVDDARRADIRWSAARDRIRWQIAEDVRRQREDAGGAPSDAETGKVARSVAVRDFLNAVWPALDAPGLLSRLYRDAAFLRRCSVGILTDTERTALLWAERPRSAAAARWSAADAVLIDELVGLIEGAPTYVHAVVDEAQDLSPMQCRAVGRRCPLGSVTVLGDLAQATTPWAPGDWSVTLSHLGHAGAQVRPLTIGYRVPGSVLALANRLLPFIAPSLPPATSVRAGADALAFATAAQLPDVIHDLARHDGSIGVIAADGDVDAVLAALRAAAIPAQPIDAEADAQVSIVPASEAKGMEFDFVAVVEPARIVAAEPTRQAGLRRLYVVLTRAVSGLAVLHDDPLPAELSPLADSAAS